MSKVALFLVAVLVLCLYTEASFLTELVPGFKHYVESYVRVIKKVLGHQKRLESFTTVPSDKAQSGTQSETKCDS